MITLKVIESEKVCFSQLHTLTADDQYSLLSRDNLTQPIGTQLFQKQKDFSQFFFALLKSTLNFEHLQKKDDLHS